MNTKTDRGIAASSLVIILGVLLVMAVAAFFSVYTIVTVEGNQVGVKETWSEGVLDKSLPPRTYWINRWTESIYPYPTSGNVFVMNDKDEPSVVNGRRSDSLKVNSLDNQTITFNMIITWRIDPLHVVNLHKEYRNNIEEKLIRPEVMKYVSTRATVQNAIDVYSGQKFNDLRQQVEALLKDPNGKLATSGVVVDSFIMEKPQLNPAYESLIEQRQLAIAQTSQAKEQKIANDAIADAARSAALKLQFETVVAAETAKKTAILQQEATSQQAIIAANADATNLVTIQKANSDKVVIAAKAEAERQVAISEAAKQAEINRAVGILAVGKSEAEATKLRLSAYAVPGADDFVKIKIAESMAQAYGNVKGFLPQNASYNVLSRDFLGGVSLLMDPSSGQTKPTVPVPDTK